jgi:hypothetical protein
MKTSQSYKFLYSSNPIDLISAIIMSSGNSYEDKGLGKNYIIFR